MILTIDTSSLLDCSYFRCRTYSNVPAFALQLLSYVGANERLFLVGAENLVIWVWHLAGVR